LVRIQDADQIRERRLTIARRIAVTAWAAIVVYRTVTTGFAFNRELLLLYICTGLLAASIGQGRRMFYVIRDWLPFALVLVAYDLSRGAATMIGRPTMWHWQVDADRWMFFGTVPTVWLQERLKLPYPPWWEIVISTVYMSFFILPYVVAAVLWLRDREQWKAFVRLFVGLSFTGLIIYTLLPAAPPWAAARCTPADVADHPSDPGCMFRSARGVPDGGLLGAMQTTQDGANLVAAIPSLHAGLTVAVAGFLWTRVQRKWRTLLLAYVLVMAFTLVYTAEHYVVDILLGWVLAAVVLLILRCFESWRRQAADAENQLNSVSPVRHSPPVSQTVEP